MDVELFSFTQPTWFPKLVYGLSIVLLVFFGGFGTVLAFKYASATKDIKEFIAATKTTGLMVISFAFYGPVLGTSGIIIVSSQAGSLGGGWQCVASFTVYEAFVPLLIALCGIYIIKSRKEVLSFVDFVRQRFGIGMFILTLLIMAFNTAILTLQEYISVAAIFTGIVDPQRLVYRPDILMVIMVAGTVAIYTALGGLRVSLITDLFQCGVGFILLILVIIFFAVTFRYPLSKDTYDSIKVGRGNPIGMNSWGANLVVLFVPFYDEANWQRVWASKNNRTIILGAIIGGLLVGIMSFVAGMLGAFSLWAGLPPLDAAGNLTIFTVFEQNLSSWIIVILVLVLLIQSQSFIDSLQNGMLATVLSLYVAMAELFQKGNNKRSNNGEGNIPGFDSYSQQVQDKIERTSNGSPDIKAKGGFFGSMKTFAHIFYKTLGARLVVVAIQIILVPISLKDISILLIGTIQGTITTMLFCGQILGLFLTNKYYNQYQAYLTTAVCFIAPHIYSHIKLKHGEGPVPYSVHNTFAYTWNPLINSLDYGLIVTVLVAGFACSTLTVALMMTIYAFKGELRPSNMKQEMLILIKKRNQIETQS